MQGNTAEHYESKAYPPLIAVYDFDDTVYNANSDDSAFGMDEELSVLLFGEFQHRFSNWHDAVDNVLLEAHRRGYDITDYRKALLSYPLSAGIRETIMMFGAAGVPQFICSDGNSAFINMLLHANGLSNYFPKEHVFTNPCYFDEEGRLRVKHFHHQTMHSYCGVNMCKGCVMHKIWSSDVLSRPFEPIPYPSSNSNPVPHTNSSGVVENELAEFVGMPKEEVKKYYAEYVTRVTSKAGIVPSEETITPYVYQGRTIYFGDGSNDICAAKQLRPTDFFAVREGYRMHRHSESLFQQGESANKTSLAFETTFGSFKERLNPRGDGCIRARRLLWGKAGSSGDATINACCVALESVGLGVSELPSSPIGK